MTHTNLPGDAAGADASSASVRTARIFRWMVASQTALAVACLVAVYRPAYPPGKPWTLFGWSAETALIVGYYMVSGLGIAVGLIALHAAAQGRRFYIPHAVAYNALYISTACGCVVSFPVAGMGGQPLVSSQVANVLVVGVFTAMALSLLLVALSFWVFPEPHDTDAEPEETCRSCGQPLPAAAAAPPGCGPVSTAVLTTEDVLGTLTAEDGPRTAAWLAEALAVSHTTVRRHLQVLIDRGQVRGMWGHGRAVVYSLTDAGRVASKAKADR